MWYYSIEGERQGPVDEPALDQLIADQVINRETFVWKEGMNDWTPLAQARPVKSPAVLIAEAAAATCTVCGKRVGAENLIDLLGKRVCADCKPMAVQSLREGALLPGRNFTAWRDGKKVVAHDNTSLPARCFKCNLEVEGPPKKRKLTWHHSAIYVLLISPLIYIIVALLVRKRATVDIHLCNRHLQRRNYFMIGGWLGALLGIVLIFSAVPLDMNWLLGFGFIVVLVAIVAGLTGARFVRAAKIDGNTVWLTGANKDFVGSLPPWTQ